MKIYIRLLTEDELEEADRIFRLAFGTFIGLSEPTNFCGDADYILTRWKSDPSAAFAAEVEGRLVGSNLATNWGSVSSFGPLSVHPEFWGQGVAQRLIEVAIDRFDRWGTQHSGLFTFPNSPTHHALYRKFGFYPRFLTFIMAKSIQEVLPELPLIDRTIESTSLDWAIQYSQLNVEQRSQCLELCAELTDSIYSGLNVTREIIGVHTQLLGDTILLWDNTNLVGFAVCHCGARSEAGSDVCYIKFGAICPGKQAGKQFERLLDLCFSFAASQKMSRLLAGVNTSHEEAYKRMVDRHFRTETTGIAMHKPNEVGYHRSDVFVLDDWR